MITLAPSPFCAVSALSALALLSGCATPSPHALAKYRPPAAGEPAAMIDVGKRGRAWAVDGTETPTFAVNIRLLPGEHRVGISCFSYEMVSIDAHITGTAPYVAPAVNTKTALQFVLVTGFFEAGKTYYTRCVVVDGQPRAWLASAQDGGDLPEGFTSICTRECPR